MLHHLLPASHCSCLAALPVSPSFYQFPLFSSWCGGIAEGSVVLTGINEKAAAEGTLAALKATVEKLKSGEVKVFDTKNFTVEGAAVTGDNVVNGIFEESKTQSAPYFELKIDGITRLNEKF